SNISLMNLGAWLGAAARQRNRRVVYSPFFMASSIPNVEPSVSQTEDTAFRWAYRDLIPDTRYLSPHLGLTPVTAYRPVCQRDRNDQLASAQSPLPYEDWLNAQALSRRARWGSQEARLTFSLLTVIYARTPADLLRETGRSILTQSHAGFEWL